MKTFSHYIKACARNQLPFISLAEQHELVHSKNPGMVALAGWTRSYDYLPNVFWTPGDVYQPAKQEAHIQEYWIGAVPFTGNSSTKSDDREMSAADMTLFDINTNLGYDQPLMLDDETCQWRRCKTGDFMQRKVKTNEDLDYLYANEPYDVRDVLDHSAFRAVTDLEDSMNRQFQEGYETAGRMQMLPSFRLLPHILPETAGRMQMLPSGMKPRSAFFNDGLDKNLWPEYDARDDIEIESPQRMCSNTHRGIIPH